MQKTQMPKQADSPSRLELALQELESGAFSLIVKKDGRVLFASRDPMLRPLLTALDTLGEELIGSTVIDRIVGKAAALLCVKARVGEVYTPLASEPALQVLRTTGIPIAAARVVPFIKNRQGDGMCPMEKLASRCNTPEEFLAALRSKNRDDSRN